MPCKCGMTLWKRHGSAMITVATLCGLLQWHSCSDHVRPCCITWHPRGALGDLTALLLHCCCEPLAFPRCSFRSLLEAEPRHAFCACTKCAPWHGVLGDPTASSGDATVRSIGVLGDPTARSSAFCVFLGCCAVAVRMPSWCDRGFTQLK